MEDDEGSLVPPVDGGCNSVRRRSPGGRRKVRAERWKHLEGLGDHDALSARLTHASVSPPHACWLTLTVGDALLLLDSTTTKKKPPLMIPLLQHTSHPEIWFMECYSVLLKLHECNQTIVVLYDFSHFESHKSHFHITDFRLTASYDLGFAI